MPYDPFENAAQRIVALAGGREAVLTRASDGSRVLCTALLDQDVELMDELGNVIERDDMISLLVSEVGRPRSRDTVEFFDSGRVYMLGRTVRDDGYVAKMVATRNA